MAVKGVDAPFDSRIERDVAQARRGVVAGEAPELYGDTLRERKVALESEVFTLIDEGTLTPEVAFARWMQLREIDSIQATFQKANRSGQKAQERVNRRTMGEDAAS